MYIPMYIPIIPRCFTWHPIFSIFSEDQELAKWRPLKKKGTSILISLSQQSLYMTKYSYRCFYRLFNAKLDDVYFVSFWQPCLCHLEGQKHGFSIQILINISSNISCTKHRTDLDLCETVWFFIKSFISLFLDFIRWRVLMMVWQWQPVIESMNYE